MEKARILYRNDIINMSNGHFLNYKLNTILKPTRY